MVVAGNLIFFILIFLGVIPALAICLQIWLSKRESKWYGLILPILSFIQSLIVSSSILLFSAVSTSSGTVTSCQMNGLTGEESCITEAVTTPQAEHSNNEVVSTLASAGATFVVFNIPTGINLLIYRHCRQSLKKKNDLSKMAVLDL